MSGCKEAPVFHPTLAEFADPLRYIASIRAVAEPCGLCRIVPPDGFVVPFNQDRASFTFKTRVQTVTELQLRVAKGKHRSWRVEYVEFMQTHEHQTVTRWPVFGGRKLDLRVLYESVVASQGGFDLACRGKLWRTIASGLEGTDASASDASALKQLYQKWLLPFETHKKRTATLSPASKAKEAASTKKEKEEERRREKASAAAAVERASAMEQPSEKEGTCSKPCSSSGTSRNRRRSASSWRWYARVEGPAIHAIFFFSFFSCSRSSRRDASLPFPRPPRVHGACVDATDRSRPRACRETSRHAHPFPSNHDFDTPVPPARRLARSPFLTPSLTNCHCFFITSLPLPPPIAHRAWKRWRSSWRRSGARTAAVRRTRIP